MPCSRRNNNSPATGHTGRVPRVPCLATLFFSCVPNQFIFNGAGGGNRTIRAYSFYVTYCKHTNARTAQPAVCLPPMYKIMYNEIGRCGVAHRLKIAYQAESLT